MRKKKLHSHKVITIIITFILTVVLTGCDDTMSHYNEGYKEGYQEGYNKGKSDGEIDYIENNGTYEDGYNTGYDEGYQAGNQESSDRIYQLGYNAGYSDMYNKVNNARIEEELKKTTPESEEVLPAGQDNTQVTQPNNQTIENPIKTDSFILNKESKVFHLPSCYHVEQISYDHRQTIQGDDWISLMLAGYTPCGDCINLHLK